ncbi:ski oncogene [Procambarus clarkii]|uniref:ski oncogene n=1 Tax=Procambarus clarkii TaxID=6728 RepID=UPI003742B598
MATPDYSPHLKRVLKSYQNAAMTSLHGPGPNSYLSDAGINKKLVECGEDQPSIRLLDAHAKHQIYRELSFKKALLYEDALKNKSETCRRCVDDSQCTWPPSPPTTHTPTTCTPTPCTPTHNTPTTQTPPSHTPTNNTPTNHTPTNHTPTNHTPTNHKPTNHTPTNHTPTNHKPTCTRDPEPRLPDIKDTAVDTATTAISSPTASVRCSGSDTCTSDTTTTTTCSSGGPGGSWVEPGMFLAPPPFPPQPWPVLAAADKGSPGAARGRQETLLDGEPIACFNVGGEKRLCLPQILNTVLREFSLGQINAVCDDLRIFCSRCTPSQLDALRVAGVLPHTAKSCGLITNTDAQRLTQALLHAHPTRAPAQAPTHSQEHPHLRVYHTCFGKCKGLVWDDLYTSGGAACIECEECHGLFPPARFVCHAHRALENQTIHWGFEAEQWRTYLLLAKDQQVPLEKAEVQLKAFKNKFDPVGANYKRKQDGVEVKEELPKKVRAEELPPTTAPSPYAPYDPSMVLSYMWRCASLAPSWTATALLTRDGKTLPPPPPAFLRDSVPATVPAYLSQGPPVLADPARVVPLSDSQKFERHYQPNVALAPPKVRDKACRELLPIKDLPPLDLHDPHDDKLAVFLIRKPVEVECIKRENCSVSGGCDQSPTSIQVTTSPTRTPQHTHQPRKLCSPDTSGRHPELELSTTDSDTDSVGSSTNHCETVEEAEGLLRGWSDKAAAGKVAQLVADLVARLAASDRQNAVLRQRLEAQTRVHNHTVTDLRNQLLANTQHNKDEDQLREKVCVQRELRTLREELHPRPPPSVIAPTSLVKTEPSDVSDTC